MKHYLSEDVADLLFRLLFSSIFLAMGGEHLFANALIQRMMPLWLPGKPIVAVGMGMILLVGALHVLLGYRIHRGATILSICLLAVTLGVHGPGLFGHPPGLPADWQWLWDVYQRSNFVKNLCLLGVCFHLLHHEPGRYSLDWWLRRSRKGMPAVGAPVSSK